MWIEWEVSGVCVCVYVVQCVEWGVCVCVCVCVKFVGRFCSLSLPRVLSIILYSNLFDSHLLQSALLKC